MSANKDGTFDLDFANSPFMKNFMEYALTTAPAAAEKGMFEALSALKNDCDNVTPKTPFKDGNLRGDYTFILEGITQSVVQEIGSKNKGGEKPAPRFGASDIIAKLILRMPYAAKWHEAVNRKVNWTQTRVSGVGPKYVEMKLMAFGKKYFELVASHIKNTTEKNQGFK